MRLSSTILVLIAFAVPACTAAQGRDDGLLGPADGAQSSATHEAGPSGTTTSGPSKTTTGSVDGAAPSPTTTGHDASAPEASAKRVFVTSSAYSGNLQHAAYVLGLPASQATTKAELAALTLKSADYLCELSADAAGIGRGWKAYLSTAATDGVPAQRAMDRLRGAGPWLRIDGKVAFPSKSALLVGPSNPPNITERNALVDRNNSGVWTATDRNGNPADFAHSCSNFWTEGGLGALGTADETTPAWAGYEDTWPCSGSRHLYCFEDQ